jgi:hypothetical protein
VFQPGAITCHQGKERCPYVAGFGVDYVPDIAIRILRVKLSSDSGGFTKMDYANERLAYGNEPFNHRVR